MPRTNAPTNDAQREQAALIKASVEVATPTCDQVAKAVGVSTAALYSWRVGRRLPRPRTRARLAETLAAQGRALLKLAEEVAKG